MLILGSFDLSFDFSFEVGSAGSICIIVTDKNGNPIEGAYVISLCNNKITDTGETDSDGKVILEAINKKYNQIIIEIEGFQTVTLTFAPPLNGDCTDVVIDYCIEKETLNLNSGNFFRFESVDYCRSFINECTEFCNNQLCENDDEYYKLPALVSDTFTFIVNPDDIGLISNYELDSNLQIGIYQGGKFIQSAGTITQSGYPDSYQLVCNVTIPHINQGDYQFGFSNSTTDLLVTVDYSNTTVGNIDGTITLTPTSGTSPYKYSIDGGLTFQVSGDYEDLQNGIYDVIVIDSQCNEFTQTIELITNADCSLYENSYVFDLDEVYFAETLNCYVNDFY
jgi:hypothetical protein